MKSLGIITDGTAQFSSTSFLGNEIIEIIPLGIEYKGELFLKNNENIIAKFPRVINKYNRPLVVLPSNKCLLRYIDTFLEKYDEIIFILTSKKIIGLYSSIKLLIKEHPKRNKMILIDSKTLSIGLGFIVQRSAELFVNNQYSRRELIQSTRKLISNTYSLLCIPCHSYLAFLGKIDQAQYLTLEINNLLPLFIIDNGNLSPQEKVKTYRNCFLLFQEFIDEFNNLDQIGFIKGIPNRTKEYKSLKKHCQNLFPSALFTSLFLNMIMAALFGPKTTSIFLMAK